MRNVVLAASVAFLAVSAHAQQAWQGSFYYDLRDREWAGVVSTKLTSLTDILGKGYSLDLGAFAGSKLNGNPIGGFYVGKPFQVADQVSAFFGAAVSVEGQKPVSFGPMLGVSVRF